MGSSVRIWLVVAGTLGLVLGWYGCTLLAPGAIRVHFFYLRVLAALAGAGTAVALAHVMLVRRHVLRAILAALAGVGLIAGAGLLMNG